MIPRKIGLLAWLAVALTPLPAPAHPFPDVPVWTSFTAEGPCTIAVEVDPRIFDPKPDQVPYFLKKDLDAAPPSMRNELIQKAIDFVKRTVVFHWEPGGPFDPRLEYAITSLGGIELKGPEDVVVITGTAKVSPPPGTTGYQIEQMKGGTRAVLFRNRHKGQELKHFEILFPGESSKVLKLAELSTARLAEPLEHIPLWLSFHPDGGCEVEMEVDPRYYDFTLDSSAAHVLNEELARMSEEDRENMLNKAKEFAHRTVEFYFPPQGRVESEFESHFSTIHGQPLKSPKDIVMITAVWKNAAPPGATACQVRAKPSAGRSTLVQYRYNDRPLEMSQTLAPGEESAQVDLISLATAKPAASDERTAVKGWSLMTLVSILAGVALLAALVWWSMRKRQG